MNIDIVMSPNPKRIKKFINADGTISDGGIEENIARSNQFGGNPPTNTIPKQAETGEGEIKND